MSKDTTIGKTLLLEVALGIALSIFFASWFISIGRPARGLTHGPARYNQRLKLSDTTGPRDLTGQYLGESSAYYAPAGPSDAHSRNEKDVGNDLAPMVGFDKGGE